MEETHLDFVEVQIVAFPERVGAAGMEEGAPAIGLLGHHVGEGRGHLGGGAEMFCVNLVALAIVQDELAQAVPADEARADQREAGAELGQVDEHIVGRAARALRLAEDVRQLLALRIDVDEFDLVNDPITAREDSAAAGIAFRIRHSFGTAAAREEHSARNDNRKRRGPTKSE